MIIGIIVGLILFWISCGVLSFTFMYREMNKISPLHDTFDYCFMVFIGCLGMILLITVLWYS
jgi:hypothetical protein